MKRVRNAVTDTTKTFTPLDLPIFGGSSQAIERSEAAGQAELCMSDVLPTDGIESVRSIIEAAGGSIGNLVKNDPMFTEVQLPQGWKKQATGHSMHSDLLDDKGRRRAGVFYKAAFYDRSARINAACRFGINSYGHDSSTDGVIRVSVSDACKQASFELTEPMSTDGSKEYTIRRGLAERIEAFLDEHYPLWKDPTQYWD